jgi:transposase InsO family protein
MMRHVNEFPIEMMCKLFAISESSFYAWRKTPHRPHAEKRRKILEFILEGRKDRMKQFYGSPRWTKELQAAGFSVSERYVARLMNSQGIKALKRRTYKATTDSSHSYSIARDHVKRDFNPTGPNQIWVSDLTYIRVGHRWMYLTIVMDLWGREIVGWSFSRTMKTHETTIPALRMALNRRGIHHGLIFHSDRGVQYADKAFRKLCAQHRILRSMSRKGDCWDNAVAESFFKTLKSEAIFGISLLELNFAQRVLFEWIEITYNRRRRHSALNHHTIPEFKESFLPSNLAA